MGRFPVITDRPALGTMSGGFGRFLGRVANTARRILVALQMVLERHRVGVQAVGYTITFSAAFILRFAALGRLGLNSDEAVYSGQAATLAGVEGFAEDFSIFRAHPLLYQYTVSLVYRAIGFNEINARLVSALFGAATLFVVYLIGKRLVDRRTGLLAAAILAVMPFHVVVARQALLESPMTLFYTAAVYALIRYFDAFDDVQVPVVSSLGWAFAIGALTGFAFMSKEVAGILLVVVFLSMLVTAHFRIGHSMIVMGAFIATVSPHLLALQLGPASERGGGWAEYVIWQVARPANHPISFYLKNVGVYFGLALLVLFVIGIGMSIRRAREHSELVAVLVSLVVPVWFFQVWKVKGFHYPVVIAPMVAVLAAYVLVQWWNSRDLALRGFASVAAIVTVASLIWITSTNGPIADNSSRVGQAGYSGIPGGREAALWLAENAPEGSRILGIGPSIGNIIRWYSDHETSALSVSPNPLRANPAYAPVRNPDFELRWGLVEYLVYDAYSAARTPHFANRLLDFVERYGGEIVHEEYAPLTGGDGEEYLSPVIRIYRVGPVGLNPLATDSDGSAE